MFGIHPSKVTMVENCKYTRYIAAVRRPPPATAGPAWRGRTLGEEGEGSLVAWEAGGGTLGGGADGSCHVISPGPCHHPQMEFW